MSFRLFGVPNCLSLIRKSIVSSSIRRHEPQTRDNDSSSNSNNNLGDEVFDEDLGRWLVAEAFLLGEDGDARRDVRTARHQRRVRAPLQRRRRRAGAQWVAATLVVVVGPAKRPASVNKKQTNKKKHSHFAPAKSNDNRRFSLPIIPDFIKSFDSYWIELRPLTKRVRWFVHFHNDYWSISYCKSLFRFFSFW